MTDTKELNIFPIKEKKKPESKPRLLPPGQKPLVEMVCEKIKEAITYGHLKEGERVLETDIATWLGISRTPIREAFRRLIDGDRLSYDRYGDLIVTIVDMRMINEVYSMRIMLDGMAARKAARNASPEIGEQVIIMSERYNLPDISRREQLAMNIAFHTIILSTANNRYLNRAYNSLPHPLSCFLQYRLSKQDQTLANRQRCLIAKAIAANDQDAAEAAAREKIRLSKARWLLRLDEANLSESVVQKNV